MDSAPLNMDLLKAALQEDFSDIGDITSLATISENAQLTAVMRARESGILAGIKMTQATFLDVDSMLRLSTELKDGDPLRSGQDILIIKGNARHILMAERVALNFLSHLSGIASETQKYVEAVQDTNTEILDTRKTLPAWRSLQKHAVKMGGGQNHRMGLYDMVLIKDNHIAAAGGVKEALDKVKKSNPDVKIEIEVDTLKQLQIVLDHGTAEIVLLDNMQEKDLTKAVLMAKGKIKTEASGNVNLETVRAIAKSGVDYISIGALTHSVKALDIGLDIEIN